MYMSGYVGGSPVHSCIPVCLYPAYHRSQQFWASQRFLSYSFQRWPGCHYHSHKHVWPTLDTSALDTPPCLVHTATALCSTPKWLQTMPTEWPLASLHFGKDRDMGSQAVLAHEQYNSDKNAEKFTFSFSHPFCFVFLNNQKTKNKFWERTKKD